MGKGSGFVIFDASPMTPVQLYDARESPFALAGRFFGTYFGNSRALGRKKKARARASFPAEP